MLLHLVHLIGWDWAIFDLIWVGWYYLLFVYGMVFYWLVGVWLPKITMLRTGIRPNLILTSTGLLDLVQRPILRQWESALFVQAIYFILGVIDQVLLDNGLLCIIWIFIFFTIELNTSWKLCLRIVVDLPLLTDTSLLILSAIDQSKTIWNLLAIHVITTISFDAFLRRHSLCLVFLLFHIII